MSFRLVRSGGSVVDPAFVNIAGSGTLKKDQVVDLSRTGGTGVFPANLNSTSTTIFGVCLDYAQGASDVFVKVIPFVQGQLWEADCANAATTAQVGIRHTLGADTDRGVVHNTATDVSSGKGVFRAVAMVGSTSGSGKLIGYFTRVDSLPDVSSATVNQY